MPTAKLQFGLEQSMLQKDSISEKLTRTEDRLKYGAEMALAFIELLRNRGEIYRAADDPVKRDLLSALFKRLLLYVDDGTLLRASPLAQMTIV